MILPVVIDNAKKVYTIKSRFPTKNYVVSMCCGLFLSINFKRFVLFFECIIFSKTRWMSFSFLSFESDGFIVLVSPGRTVKCISFMAFVHSHFNTKASFCLYKSLGSIITNTINQALYRFN